MMIDYRTAAAGGEKIPFFKKIVLRLYHSIIFKKFAFLVDILAKTPLQKKLAIPRRRKANIRSLYSKKPDQSQHDILFFPGCVLTYFYPEVIKKTVSFIRAKGFSVVMPRGMVCCGFPYLSQGWKKRFFSFMKKNKDIFSRYRFKYLVVPCGTGVMTFRNYYNFEDKNIEIFELTDFFYRFIQDAVVDFDGFKTSTGKITFHDPCHHLKSLGIAKEPRFFLKQLEDNFVDDQSALCCGFGGIFSVGFPSTAKKILKRKHDTMKELGAGTVITACPGCYMHLKENLSTNKDMDVKFFIDLFLPHDKDSSSPLDSSGH
jgi:glycolate oxidase iron-sulfur subunit